MATRKPTPKPAPKPAAKPAPKPVEKNLKGQPKPPQAPKPAPIPEERPLPPTPTPKPAPLDLVRNPNFDSAMAQQNYQNSLAEQRARIDAERGLAEANRNLRGQLPPQDRGNLDFIDSGKFGRITPDFGPQVGRAFPSEFSRPSPESKINPEVLKKARDEYVEQNPGEVNRRTTADIINSRYLGQIGRGMDGFDKWFETNYINNPNSALSEQERMTLRIPELKLPPEDRGVDIGVQGDFRAPIRTDEDKKRIYDDLMARQGQLYPPGSTMPTDPNIGMPRLMPIPELGPPPQGRQAGGGMGGQGNFPADVAQSQYIDPQSPEGQAMEKQRQMARDALSRYNPNVPSLMPIQTPGSGALNQGQQMQDYQNFLKQGMQNSNTLNQGAMAGFANMQPGMQVPQAGVQVPQPGMQVPPAGIGQTKGPNMAGMATQQRRQNPAQRKFSTFSNKPAKFF